MSQLSRYYLQEMGILQWQCHKPEHYPHLASQAKKVALPKTCKLLLVTNDNVNAHSHFISQVLRPLQLDISQCHVVTESELSNYYQEPDWLWFMGSQVSDFSAKNQLQSAELDTLLHSAKAKRELWQQIIKLLN